MATALRVFISSPADVRQAREMAAQVLEKIAQDYCRHFSIEPYLWENDALLASGHFQDSIEQPASFDIVVLILWSRLGQKLPSETAVRRYDGIDGRTGLTGTEWEFENALLGWRDRGIPDILVYRSTSPTAVDSWNAEQRRAQLEQLAALDHFWERHFAKDGTFIGAYHQFSNLQNFADNLEGGLRKLISRRIAALTQSREGSPVTWEKAPFRGLQSFEFEHAPIFFGRNEVVGKALLQLLANNEAGRAFLLILGASGSGKSSITKAGIAPKLLVTGRVPGKYFARRMTFRPADRDAHEDLFDAFARILTAQMAHGVRADAFGSPAELARHLRAVPAQAGRELASAFRILEAAEPSQAGGTTPALLLILDQMEELYAADIALEERCKFIELLDAFARSGQAFVIATMRADFWHRAAETPSLLVMSEGYCRFDVPLPTGGEILEMINRPAEMAGISFERNATTDIRLNSMIAEEAMKSPGTLPLLSYLLEQLYTRDIIEGGGHVLTYASYEALGGLRGSIAQRAETILAAQPEAVQKTLRRVIFSLVQVSISEAGEAIMQRRAPMDIFTGDSRRLVEALLDPQARLLIGMSDSDGRAMVRVAHEALLADWAHAREIISSDTYYLRIRRRIEERFDANEKGNAPLLSGTELDDGLRLQQEFGVDLPPDVGAFIARSQRQRDRLRRRTIAASMSAAILMAFLFVVAASLFVVAQRERNSLSDQYSILRTTQISLQNAADASHRAFINSEVIGRGLLTQGNDAKDAIGLFSSNAALGEKLIGIYPHDNQLLYNLASTDYLLGYALYHDAQPGELASAREYFARAAALADQLSKVDASTPLVRKDRLALQALLKNYNHP